MEEEKIYPSDIFSDRNIYKPNGKWIIVPPTESRLEERKAIYDAMHSNSIEIKTIDAIIDHFSRKYEGVQWTGLGRKARRQPFIEQKGRCYWCKVRLTMANFTVEHIKPRVEWVTEGEDDWSNLTIACPDCNHRRTGEIIDQMGRYIDQPDELSTNQDVTLPVPE